jgi:hypothetical protein
VKRILVQFYSSFCSFKEFPFSISSSHLRTHHYKFLQNILTWIRVSQFENEDHKNYYLHIKFLLGRSFLYFYLCCRNNSSRFIDFYVDFTSSQKTKEISQFDKIKIYFFFFGSQFISQHNSSLTLSFSHFFLLSVSYSIVFRFSLSLKITTEKFSSHAIFWFLLVRRDTLKSLSSVHDVILFISRRSARERFWLNSLFPLL